MNIIKDIRWERTNLIFVFEKLDSRQKIFLTKDEEVIELSFKDNILKILLTNTPEGTILPEGKWRIACGLKKIVIDESIVSKLDDYSRIFKYKGDNYAYLVTFSISEEKELFIHTQFMMKNRKPHKSRPLFETKSKVKKIKNIIQKVSLWIANLIYKLAHNLNFTKKNTVLFLSENGNELIGNSLAFYNYLNDKKEYRVKKYCKNVFVKKLNYFERLKEMFILASSNYIIVDNYTPILTYLNIAEDVKIVQLWHAGVGFKAVGYARFGQKGSPHPYISGHRKYDYVVVDDESLIEVYEEVFGVSKAKFIPAGMPRLEDYLNKEKINKTVNNLYKENENLKNKKIILFAPTFRGTGQTNAYYNMELINQSELAEFCKNNNYIVIFKFHPFTDNKIEINSEYKDIFFDYTFKYDINELMYITDVLITDYSSCAYEYSLFDRPMVFYRPDKILYEYDRKIHTKNMFTKETYEALSFNEVINCLNKVLNKDKFDIQKCEIQERSSACEIIEKEIFGRK